MKDFRWTELLGTDPNDDTLLNKIITTSGGKYNKAQIDLFEATRRDRLTQESFSMLTEDPE